MNHFVSNIKKLLFYTFVLKLDHEYFLQERKKYHLLKDICTYLERLDRV